MLSVELAFGDLGSRPAASRRRLFTGAGDELPRSGLVKLVEGSLAGLPLDGMTGVEARFDKSEVVWTAASTADDGIFALVVLAVLDIGIFAA